MNEITQEERKAIFHAYHTAQVLLNVKGDDDCTNPNITDCPCSIFSISKDGVWLENEEAEIDECYSYDCCQLLLKDLSEITDSDAIEVAKMCAPIGYNGFDPQNAIIERRDKMVIITSDWNDNIVMIIHFDLAVLFCQDTITKQEAVSSFYRAGFDYLRSRSYNIGHGKYSPSDLLTLRIVKSV